MLELMFACPSGDVFIGSIGTTREQKDAHYICNALVGYIETIGINNIIQICTDNVSSMKNVADLLIYHFPSLYFQGCVVHCLDLLLENWGKVTWAKWIVKKVKVVVFFIQWQHVPLTIFRHYETNLMLLNPTETQFATNVLIIERLFKFRLTIEQIVVDCDWTTFVNSLHGSHNQKSLTKVKVVQANIKTAFGYLC